LIGPSGPGAPTGSGRWFCGVKLKVLINVGWAQPRLNGFARRTNHSDVTQSRNAAKSKKRNLIRTAFRVNSWKDRIDYEQPLDLSWGAKPRESVMARPNFIELPTRDLAASQVFFDSIFGMKMTQFGPTYACTMTGDVDIGLQAEKSEASEAPLPVIEVADLEATLRAVTAAGAEITKAIFSFPGGRRFQFRDPSGNELAAMQPDSA
jgi:predicted enzyme related to lactoylglutathione lyase